MGGNLKKRGLDRDTIATQRALSQISDVTSGLSTAVRGLGTTIDDIASFDYTVVEVNETAGTWPYPVSASDSEAVISAAAPHTAIVSWEITGGNLNVTLDNPCVARFLVF